MASSNWSEPRHRRGLALVGVLWVLVLLSLIVLNISASSRLELKLAANLVEAAQRRHVNDAAVNWALWSLLQPGTAGWLADGSRRQLSLEDYQIEVAMQDEHGKIDLNEGNPLLLQGLFLSVGLQPEVAVALADAILDWRDSDELRRLHGAEAEEYRAAGLAEPGNRLFEHLEELRLVLGMSPALYEQVAPLLTLYSGQTQINPLVAPQQVLLAVPGVSEANALQYIEQRRSTYEQGLPTPPFGSVDASLLNSNMPGISYAIETAVSKAGSIVSRQNLIIRRRGGMGSRFEILSLSSPPVAPEPGREPAVPGEPL